ncbi:MAG: FAD-dependent oxidoreductase [Candidatus Nanopelagicales bacterium]
MTSTSGGWSRDASVLKGTYEVVIIGAGITGIWSAVELARRGVTVLVLDKGDVGSGTSSATTKFIHGGLRYLEQGDVVTVAESVRERRMLAAAAPGLVAPQRFLLPVWEWTRPSAPLIGLGLTIYESLALGRNRGLPVASRVPRAHWLSARATLNAVPWLRPEGLRGSFAYYDMANVHPERLLLTITRTALDQGARILTYAPVRRITTASHGSTDVVNGVDFLDLLTGVEHHVSARYVVNAAGPWADIALGDLGERVGLRVKRAKGVHMLTRALGGSDAVFARTRSGRHVVVSPWQGNSFIGPTDTPVEDGPDDVAVDVADVEDLIEAVGDISVRTPGPGDILGATVGVRPLIHDGREGSYATSRRHRLHHHERHGLKGMLSVTGGKWTTGHAVGVDVADAVTRSLGIHSRGRAGIDLHGTLSTTSHEEARTEILSTGVLPPPTVDYLLRLYGVHTLDIHRLVVDDPRLGAPVVNEPHRRDILAQAIYAATDEGAVTLEDVLMRRLVAGTQGRLPVESVARVGEAIAPMLGWDRYRCESEVDTHVARARELDAVIAHWQSLKEAHTSKEGA